MSKSPHNAGQTIEIEHLIHGPVSTVDLGKITVTENWGRLFIKQGDSNEVVIERGAYVALRDAIDHFIEPQPGPRDKVIKGLGPIADLLPDAVTAAEKAMRKYPQPNYVISKWAEETGEVTKDLIHMAEGRQTVEKLRGEIVQSLAMLHRLLVEGDQVHGLPPIAAALAAAKEIIK